MEIYITKAQQDKLTVCNGQIEKVLFNKSILAMLFKWGVYQIRVIAPHAASSHSDT